MRSSSSSPPPQPWLDRDDDVERLQNGATVIQEIMSAPDSGMPDEIITSAKCIAVIPSMLKAAFGVGGAYGKGVASCRTETGWSAPAFFYPPGRQLRLPDRWTGGRHRDAHHERSGNEQPAASKVKLGADASVAAGPVGRHADASTDWKMRAEVLTYSRTRGVFAGISLNGAVLNQHREDTRDFYGHMVPFRTILHRQDRIAQGSRSLARNAGEVRRKVKAAKSGFDSSARCASPGTPARITGAGFLFLVNPACQLVDLATCDLIRSVLLMRIWLEYLPVWLIAQTLRWLPRPVARSVARGIAISFYWCHPRLRRVGMRNLELAFPEKSPAERERILKGVYLSLGRLLAEIPKFPDYTLENVDRIAVYDGLENYLAARDRGKGVLFMTAHLGGWEIGSFVHSLHGHWLNIVVRDLDNPLLDRWVRGLRSLHGNRTYDKDEYARGLLAAMKRGETVGALMDTNMTPPQGVFVNYFGLPGLHGRRNRPASPCTPARPCFRRSPSGTRRWASTASALNRRFPPSAPETTKPTRVANTQNYTAAIEQAVRAHPDQWLWVHRRWKTRPAGEPGTLLKPPLSLDSFATCHNTAPRSNIQC